MGLLEKIFHRPAGELSGGQKFQTLTAYQPVFTSWGGSLYENNLVRSSIHALAVHSGKLNVVVHGSGNPRLQTRLRQGPNSWQTWGQFLYRLRTILEIQNTAFIVPVQDLDGKTIGVFPVLPSRCEIVEYLDVLWLRYQFRTGQWAAVEFDACGILTKFQYNDDFFGEKNTSLTPTMELIHIQNQGIAEGVRSSATFRFMARSSNFQSPTDLAKEQKRFTENNLSSGNGGVLLFPNTYADIRQIESKPFIVDEKQMGLIRQSVFEYFGVNSDILQNKAFGDTWNAFYEGAIEPFSIQFSDVLTRMLFTSAERSRDNYIMATSNRLQFMSNKEKLEVSNGLGDRGVLDQDEIREIWHMEPLPNGLGKLRTVRGEYYLIDVNGKIIKKGDDSTNANGTADPKPAE